MLDRYKCKAVCPVCGSTQCKYLMKRTYTRRLRNRKYKYLVICKNCKHTGPEIVSIWGKLPRKSILLQKILDNACIAFSTLQ